MERPSWTIIFVPVVGIRLRLADCYANTVAVGVAVTTMSTGDWQLLYERYYRRRHLYDMAWPRPVQLSAASRLVFFEAASFGGPFGMRCDCPAGGYTLTLGVSVSEPFWAESTARNADLYVVGDLDLVFLCSAPRLC